MNNPVQPAKQLSTFDDPNAHQCVDDNESCCLSAEIDNYNNLLKNYQADLYRWLSNANHFKQFEKRISEELHQFGLSDWSFSQLGDLAKANDTTNLKHRSSEMGETFSQVFSECDLILQHARVCDHPVYQSQIETHIKSAPYSTELMDRYLLLVAMIKQQGYGDLYCIPIVEAFDKKRAVFCVSSKGMNCDDFKARTSESKDMLKVLGKVISDVGGLKYPDYFISVKTRYKQLIKLQPFNLLAAMIDYDLNEEEKNLGLPLRSAVQYLSKIRKKLLSSSKES